MERRIKVINLSDTLALPSYATPGSAGMDLPACFDNREKRIAKVYRRIGDIQELDLNVDTVITMFPSERALIPSNVKYELTEGSVALIPSRSGLSIKQGCIVVNSPGVVDEDYRGIVHICIINLGFKPVTIRHGDALAQMIVTSYDKVLWEEVDELSETERGSGGFGHTGVKR